ncbi:hypothetical protein ACVW00_003137 [Marmoricola sp. URHA0025 HA25]
MAAVRKSLRQRVARRVAPDLFVRIDELEAEVQENRNLNLRVAELVDLVQELLIPVASQDRERIDAALAKFQRSL